MNKKSKDLEMKINNSLIISNDVKRGLNATNFFIQQQKKQDEMKLFNDEFNKVNI